MTAKEIRIPNHDDLGGIIAFPWKDCNRAKFIFYCLILPEMALVTVYLLAQLVHITIPQLDIQIFQLILLSGIYIYNLHLQRVRKSLAIIKANLPKTFDIRQEARIIDSDYDLPGIIQISNDTLIIAHSQMTPLFIPISQLTGFQEDYLCHDETLLGNTACFSLTIPHENRRIAFAVSHPQVWKSILLPKPQFKTA